MYPEERQQAIAARVMSQGSASVAELAQTYDVTTETVRRDLSALERMGLVRRVHGGAVPGRALSLIESGHLERDTAQNIGQHHGPAGLPCFGGSARRSTPSTCLGPRVDQQQASRKPQRAGQPRQHRFPGRNLWRLGDDQCDAGEGGQGDE